MEPSEFPGYFTDGIPNTLGVNFDHQLLNLQHRPPLQILQFRYRLPAVADFLAETGEHFCWWNSIPGKVGCHKVTKKT